MRRSSTRSSRATCGGVPSPLPERWRGKQPLRRIRDLAPSRPTRGILRDRARARREGDRAASRAAGRAGRASRPRRRSPSTKACKRERERFRSCLPRQRVEVDAARLLRRARRPRKSPASRRHAGRRSAGGGHRRRHHGRRHRDELRQRRHPGHDHGDEARRPSTAGWRRSAKLRGHGPKGRLTQQRDGRAHGACIAPTLDYRRARATPTSSSRRCSRTWT